VEGAAAEAVDEARRTGQTRVVHYGISDAQAWEVGLACGGTIDVLIEPSVPVEASAAARTPGTVVIAEVPTDTGTDSTLRLVFSAGDGLRGTTGDTGADSQLVAAASEALLRDSSRVVEAGGRQFFLEAYPVNPRLVIVGAVEIARPLVRLARELGFESVVVDGRPAFATKERFPEAEQIVIGWLDEVAREIGLSADDSVVVLAHDPKFDEPAIVEAMSTGCRYVGAIGSKKTQAERRERLRAQGVSDGDLARLHGPIGLDLGGRAPAETALAILAEVVAERYGATGEALTS
jgi:xanthine dehydrogenase accessory factor